MTYAIAQFDAESLNHAIAEYGPAEIVVTGKTAMDKKLSVIAKASDATRQFSAAMKGKVGQAARENMREHGLDLAARAAAKANYRPLAEMLTLITGESVAISNRASYIALGDRYAPKLAELEAADKRYTGTTDKDGNPKFTAKYQMYLDALILVRRVQQSAEEYRKEAFEERQAVIAQENKGADE